MTWSITVGFKEFKQIIQMHDYFFSQFLWLNYLKKIVVPNNSSHSIGNAYLIPDEFEFT
jgi:hypothetical protein